MPKEGSNAWYRAYADRFYLDRANRDTYLARQAAADLLTSGHLYLPTKLVRGLDTPSLDGDAARKAYVDALVALYLPLAGGALTGDVTVSPGKTIDGVDIGAHAIDPDAHHEAQPTNHKARAYPSAAQTIPDAELAKVILDTEDYDPGSHFADSKFTVALAGYYLIIGAVGIAALASAKMVQSYIYKNGAVVLNGSRTYSGASGANVSVVSSVLLLAVDDYLELYVYNGDTADRDTSAPFTHLSVHLISA